MKQVIIDHRMRDIEKNKLKALGYELIEIPTGTTVYPEISSHVDIFCAQIGTEIILEKSIYPVLKNKLKPIPCYEGESVVKQPYPYDIPYNVCLVGAYAIHSFSYTDKTVLQQIERSGMKQIEIKQGYSNCSIAVIDENSVIVTDRSIANKLSKYGIAVLLVENTGHIRLPLTKDSYSTMHGFIGGCISRLGNSIFISGELEKIDPHHDIRDFILQRGIPVIEFPGLDVVDYGGIIECCSLN